MRVGRGDLEQGSRGGWKRCASWGVWSVFAPLRAEADLAAGILAAATGDHERARSLLEDAADRFQQSGAPYEGAQPRGIELATSLVALGRVDEAESEAAAARNVLVELGGAGRRARCS